MFKNVFHTKKKYKNKNDYKYLSPMLGGASSEELETAKKEIENERVLIQYLNKSYDFTLTKPEQINYFEITDEDGADYTLAALNTYIQELLQLSAEISKPFKVIIDDSEEKYIPLIVQRVNEYRKLLVEIEKLKRKEDMIESIPGFNNTELQDSIEIEKKNLGDIYDKLNIKRSTDSKNNISHLYDFYIHKKLVVKKEEQLLKMVDKSQKVVLTKVSLQLKSSKPEPEEVESDIAEPGELIFKFAKQYIDKKGLNVRPTISVVDQGYIDKIIQKEQALLSEPKPETVSKLFEYFETEISNNKDKFVHHINYYLNQPSSAPVFSI